MKKNRFTIFYISLAALSLILLIRFAYIMLTPAPSFDSVNFPTAERGPILDRNGKILALETELFSIEAWLPSIVDIKECSSLLASALDKVEEESLFTLLSESTANFLYIKRKISPTEAASIRALQTLGKLKGISIKPEYGRNYPEKELAAHVVGYTGTDNIGLNGVEYTYNSILSPPLVGDLRDTVYGNQVYLTIDLNIQYMMEKIARKTFDENKAERVMILVMDAKNGEILSYVSLPSFDPNKYGEYSQRERENAPTTYTYEPGSVFKIFSVASFLELGGITEEDYFDTSRGYNPSVFQKYKITPITDLGNYGKLNAESTLIYSSNVGVSFMSETVDKYDYYRMLKNFGFGLATGIPLNGESNGILKEPKNWHPRSKPTISFGQEIGVSAMQMLRGSSVFANSGLMIKPHLIKKIVAPDGTLIKEYEKEPIREVVSPAVADSILQIMQKVTEKGTARRARIDGFNISAKTGTAQRYDSETGLYSETDYTGSILAIFPTEDPKVIVYIVIDRPLGDYTYGGRIGSPMIKEIASTLIPIMGLNLEDTKKLIHTGDLRLNRNRLDHTSNSIPSFTGYSKRAILDYCRKKELELKIKGEGWAIFQFPPEGTIIEKNMSLYVELK